MLESKCIIMYLRMLHMKKKLCAVFLIIGLVSSLSVGASAKKADIASVEAQQSIGIVAADYPVVGTRLEPDAPLPSSYSSQEYATPVRRQVNNTCWAYSSTAVMEVFAAKAGLYDGYISPQHMNYWATTREDGTGWQRSYYDGGYPYIAMGYLTSNNGAIKESDFPSTSTFEDYQNTAGTLTPFLGVNSLIYLDAADRDTIKTAVYRYGAAVGNFHSITSYLNTATSSYYFYTEKDLTIGELRGHSVAIVGWDDDYSRENFNENCRPDHNGAWLCKNSWGSGWCNMGGYFWISYEDKYLFCEDFGPSFAIIGTRQYTDENKLYQDEEYGAICDFGYIRTDVGPVAKNKKLTFVNVFDFDTDFRDVSEVIFESIAVGRDYEISYIPLDEQGVPTDDESLWIPLGSGTVDYQGYICADINDYRVPEGKGGIGVTLKMTEPGQYLSVGVSEWLSYEDEEKLTYLFKPPVQRGVSYVIGFSNSVDDVMDLYALDPLNDDIGGSFVIKAVAEKNGLMGDVDRDDQMTIVDVTAIQRYLADLNTFDGHQKLLADYDADRIVTILDCTKIQRVLADLDEPLYPLELTD